MKRDWQNLIQWEHVAMAMGKAAEAAKEQLEKPEAYSDEDKRLLAICATHLNDVIREALKEAPEVFGLKAYGTLSFQEEKHPVHTHYGRLVDIKELKP